MPIGPQLTARPEGEESDMQEEMDAGSLGLAFQGRPFQAYNEQAFRYFLGIERNRGERSRRSSLLVLVNLRRHPDMRPQDCSPTMTPSVAAKIFAGLSLCVREVDFVGWHRENRVAGAVLAQGTDTPDADVTRRISQRVTEVVGENLPAQVARRLHVRLVHLRPRQKS
jgi:hypothetical protein